ncbi:DUF4129 domain-containing protein [Microbacterium sp. PMB16]|uniref:DUF4129 domain-containing protein n=1 Tax=Microbacterium sp. PMB16 TaxID=3120157 RepID=UPI003F4C1AF6
MSRPEPPVTEQEAVPHNRAVRLVLPLISVVALFIVVMLAAGLQGLPQFSDVPLDGPDETSAPPPPPIPSSSPSPMPEPPEDSLLLTIIAAVLATIVGAVILAVVYLGVRMAIRYLAERWRDRPLARREAAEVDLAAAVESGAEVEPDVATMRRGIAEALRTIDERPDPGDSIVAAWVGLEETAADAGAGRGVNETPSEFTVRIIGRRAGITDDVTELLGLYERVRFGGYRPAEADRARASVCLRGIQKGWR